MASTSKIKIYTFESNRAGGLISILLHAKVDFKVKKISLEEWDAKKDKFHGQTLPIVKIDGVQYCNELPTLLYLGKKFDMLGSSVEDECIT